MGEVLGQLVAGVVVAADDATNDPRLLEDGDVAVRRALWQLVAGAEDLGDREGPVVRHEGLHDGPPVRGVALVHRGQSQRGFIVDVIAVVSHGGARPVA